MAFIPPNPNGQATSANSAPVVIASDQTNIPVSGSYIVNAAASAGSLNADFMALDLGNYRYVSFIIGSSAYVGTLTFQGSNDNFATVSTVYLQRSDNNTGTSGSTTSGTSISYQGYVPHRYFRIRMTAYTSGTASGSYFATSIPAYNTGQNQQVQQSGTWTSTTTGANALATGTVATSSTTVTGSTNFNGGGLGQVTVQGTYAGVSFNIQVSADSGTTYQSCYVYDASASQWLTPGSTITPGTNATKTYYFPLYANATAMKLVSTAWTSGTMNVRWTVGQNMQPGSTMAQIMDAAGNGRGINVTATNAALVDLSTTTTNTNPLLVTEQKTATATITSVAGAITSTTVLASNASRKGAYFYNDSTAILYLAYAATASTSAYTIQIAAGGYYEMPEKPIYTGLITGIWASATGNARITELS